MNPSLIGMLMSRIDFIQKYGAEVLSRTEKASIESVDKVFLSALKKKLRKVLKDRNIYEHFVVRQNLGDISIRTNNKYFYNLFSIHQTMKSRFTDRRANGEYAFSQTKLDTFLEMFDDEAKELVKNVFSIEDFNGIEALDIKGILKATPTDDDRLFFYFSFTRGVSREVGNTESVALIKEAFHRSSYATAMVNFTRVIDFLNDVKTRQESIPEEEYDLGVKMFRFGKFVNLTNLGRKLRTHNILLSRDYIENFYTNTTYWSTIDRSVDSYIEHVRTSTEPVNELETPEVVVQPTEEARVVTEVPSINGIRLVRAATPPQPQTIAFFNDEPIIMANDENRGMTLNIPALDNRDVVEPELAMPEQPTMVVEEAREAIGTLANNATGNNDVRSRFLEALNTVRSRGQQTNE